MNNQFFVSCLESRMEEEKTWYSRFEIGPFETGQALTVANSLRRTLLAQQKGVFLVAVEIEGAIHEYSRLEGVKESILDILLNLRQLSLILKDENQTSKSSKTLIGYFDVQGPGVVMGKDLKFPKQIECVNPNQIIATLTRNSSFQGRFLISINSNINLKNNSIGDPVKFSRELVNDELSSKIPNAQWLYVNPILHPIQRANYVIQQLGDSIIQKEVIFFEFWTNGTVHPRKAIQLACSDLASLFNSLAMFNENSVKFSSSLKSFKDAKFDKNNDFPSSLGSKEAFGFLSKTDNKEELVNRVSTLLDLDIANLNFSLKIYLTLKKQNIENIGNLLQYKKSDLQILTHFSSEQMNEVEKALQILGLKFI